MASLILTFSDLHNRVARYLGTYGTSGASGSDLTDAKEAVHQGYRRFLGAIDGHQWSFLKRSASISLISGQWQYDLPNDFTELVVPFHFSVNSGYPPPDERSEDFIIQARAESSPSSYPEYFNIRAGTYSKETGQNYEVIMWPTPNSAYVWIYSYLIFADKLSGDDDIPVGGPEISEVIAQCCLAAAESEIEDNIGKQEGKATKMLAEAVKKDANRSPRNLGYNLDGRGIDRRALARGEYRLNDVNYET